MNVIDISDDVDNMTLCNCTENDNILIEISPILFIIITLIPCLLSILCLIIIPIYTIVKNLLNKNIQY